MSKTFRTVDEAYEWACSTGMKFTVCVMADFVYVMVW